MLAKQWSRKFQATTPQQLKLQNLLEPTLLELWKTKVYSSQGNFKSRQRNSKMEEQLVLAAPPP